MKAILSIWIAGSMLVSAGVTLTGVAVTNTRNRLSSSVINPGSLGLLLVDIQGNGFIGLGSIPTPNFSLTPAFDPHIPSSRAGLVAGSYFGDDLILGVLTASGPGTFSDIIRNRDISGLEFRDFAVVWFDNVLTVGAPLSATEGTRYGIVRGNDWTLPPVNSGTYAMSSNDSDGIGTYYTANMLSPVGSIAFKTALGTQPAASFVVVPEPSAALIFSIGLFGCLRRRR